MFPPPPKSRPCNNNPASSVVHVSGTHGPAKKLENVNENRALINLVAPKRKQNFFSPQSPNLSSANSDDYQFNLIIETSKRFSTFPRYLLQRRGIFFFRMRVPQDLQNIFGRKEYRRSLGTANRREARPKALRMGLALNELFTIIKESKSMNLGQDLFSPATFGLPLTPERIRALADFHLDQSLQSSFARRLLWGRRGEGMWEVEKDVFGDALVEMLEDIESGNTPREIEQLADSLLDEHGIENPKNASENENMEDDQSGELAYRMLCDRLQRAEAAVLESQIAAPCWDGSLKQAPGWKVSMAEGFIKDRKRAEQAAAQPESSIPLERSADVVIRRGEATAEEPVIIPAVEVKAVSVPENVPPASPSIQQA